MRVQPENPGAGRDGEVGCGEAQWENLNLGPVFTPVAVWAAILEKDNLGGLNYK